MEFRFLARRLWYHVVRARRLLSQLIQLRKGGRQGAVDEVNLLHDFRSEFSAPVTGITPSTQVGRLSGSHFDIGFQLAQFPGRKW